MNTVPALKAKQPTNGSLVNAHGGGAILGGMGAPGRVAPRKLDDNGTAITRSGLLGCSFAREGEPPGGMGRGATLRGRCPEIRYAPGAPVIEARRTQPSLPALRSFRANGRQMSLPIFSSISSRNGVLAAEVS
ncbi:MAG TPA: hypothetical protein VKP30_19120 [Polyangiaceae bacterium]|nr:hypothetical protein [Polyangiaceae bacterium]